MQKIAKSNTKQEKIIKFGFLDKFEHSKMCKITTKNDKRITPEINESYPFWFNSLFYVPITEPSSD